MKSRVPSIDETELHTWFERDRAHVELRDKRTGNTIIEWWDEDVAEAVEDGFLSPRDYHTSAYNYAKEMGMLGKRTRTRKNPRTLRYDKTGKAVKVGDKAKTFRGEQVTVTAIREPQHSGSTGRVALRGRAVPRLGPFDREFFPGVIGASWKDNPTKLRPLAANQTELETDDGYTVFFSYQTPVAVHVPGVGYFRTNKKWSPTTSKHITRWLHANGATEVKTMEQEQLDSMVHSGGGFRKNPRIPLPKAERVAKAKQIFVQRKEGAMWITIAMAQNTSEGIKKAKLWAQQYHRRNPHFTIRLFV